MIQTSGVDGDDNGGGGGYGNDNVDVEMSGNSQHEVQPNVQPEIDAPVHGGGGGSNGTPAGTRGPKRKHVDVDEGPVNMNELRLRQLIEDRDAYRYDLQWCQDVLDNDDLTPAEVRTFQMRQLDLGHQLRQSNHRIADIESDVHNLRYFGAPIPAYGRSGYAPALHTRTSFMSAEPPQERRGPGRPPGSKNRPKDAVAYPQAPSSNAQKAAALASAGAKRTLPTEIRVATRKSLDLLSCESCRDCHRVFAPDLDAPVNITCAFGHGFILTPRRLANGRAPASASGTTDNPNKRPRVEVGSPIGSLSETENDVTETTKTLAADNARRSVEGEDNKEDEETKKNTTPTARRTARTRDTTKEDDRVQNGATPTSHAAHGKKNINASSVGATPTASSSSHVLPTRTPASGKKTGASTGTNTPAPNSTMKAEPSTPPIESDPTGPGGTKYQRLGHHMCQLCTSQKYLMQTTPKQPSEPSSWPLRDISKMVTHYTRMHGEHNKMERCMELGRALEENRGPFRYWLQETKRVKVPLKEVNLAIEALNEGQLPDLLRRLSNAARGFPKD